MGPPQSSGRWVARLGPATPSRALARPLTRVLSGGDRKYNEHEEFILEYTGRTDGLLNTPSNEWISEHHKPKVKRNWMVPRLKAIWRDLWEQ